MSGGLVTAAYIVAAILFIFSLAGLSKHETRSRATVRDAGMAIALLATILGPDTGNVVDNPGDGDRRRDRYSPGEES
jgi:NAD(P) transhydrogenase subunit beta